MQNFVTVTLVLALSLYSGGKLIDDSDLFGVPENKIYQCTESAVPKVKVPVKSPPKTANGIGSGPNGANTPSGSLYISILVRIWGEMGWNRLLSVTASNICKNFNRRVQRLTLELTALSLPTKLPISPWSTCTGLFPLPLFALLFPAQLGLASCCRLTSLLCKPPWWGNMLFIALKPQCSVTCLANDSYCFACFPQGLASIKTLSVTTLRGWLFAAGIAGPNMVVQIQGFNTRNNDLTTPDVQAMFACAGANIPSATTIPAGSRCM